MNATTAPAVAIRAATASDGPALARLAELDSARMPAGPLLLAEVDGAVQAALSLHDGRVIADPFAPTAEVVGLLRLRAAHMRRAGSAGLRLIRPPRRLRRAA
jgi:hypothetical protein